MYEYQQTYHPRSRVLCRIPTCCIISFTFCLLGGTFLGPHSSSFQAWAAPTLCEVESLWRRAVDRVLSGSER